MRRYFSFFAFEVQGFVTENVLKSLKVRKTESTCECNSTWCRKIEVRILVPVFIHNESGKNTRSSSAKCNVNIFNLSKKNLKNIGFTMVNAIIV